MATMPPTRVFVSYSHQDRVLFGNTSLLGHLQRLLGAEVEFWWDQRLTAGDLWDDVIKAEIGRAQIALVLVSQPFLGSAYCQVEANEFLAERVRRGLVVLPVLVEPCPWEDKPWLSCTQMALAGAGGLGRSPRGGRRRADLFASVGQHLKRQVCQVRQSLQSMLLVDLSSPCSVAARVPFRAAHDETLTIIPRRLLPADAFAEDGAVCSVRVGGFKRLAGTGYQYRAIVAPLLYNGSATGDRLEAHLVVVVDGTDLDHAWLGTDVLSREPAVRAAFGL